MERTNFRHVKPEDIGEPVDFALPMYRSYHLKNYYSRKEILKPEGSMVCLINRSLKQAVKRGEKGCGSGSGYPLRSH